MKSIQNNNGKAQQLLATISITLLSVSSGIGCGWPSPVIPQLRSNNPPVGDEPMSEEQISWLSGLLPIGSLLSIPFCGILAERLGRRKFAYLTAIPHLTSWLLVTFGRTHLCLHLARLFMGMSSAATIFIVPLYVSEIASEDIRGILGSLMMFAANAGILVAYVAGAFLPYRLFAGLSLLFPVIFLGAFAAVPETPAFLARRNRLAQARKSLMFFRGNAQSLVEQELRRLQKCDNASKAVGLKEFYADRATRMGLIISFALLGGQQLSGILAMLSYAETIFQRAGTTISSETAPIVIGVIQMFGSYTSTMLMDRAGRRMLTLVSCFGMAVSHSLIALFFNLQRHEYDVASISWLPLAAFSTYIAFYCFGMGPVPFVFTSEIFRLEVSSSASTICYIFYWTMSSAVVKAFGPVMNHFGMDVCFVVLASFCVACSVISYWLMPETKGRVREDIVDELAGNVECRQDERQREKDQPV